MERDVKIKMEHGYYLFKLGNILKQHGISKNKLMNDTNTDFKVIQRLISGNIVRIDIEVLARFCSYLNCSITDIIEYRNY